MQSKVIIDLTEDDDSPQRSRETSTPGPRSSALPRTPATTVRVASTPTQGRGRQLHVMARDSAGPSMSRWDLKINTESLEPSFGALPITPATTASVVLTPARTGSRDRQITFGDSAARPSSSALPMTPASAVSVELMPVQTANRQRYAPAGDSAAPPSNLPPLLRRIMNPAPSFSALPTTPATTVSIVSTPAPTAQRQACTSGGDSTARLQGEVCGLTHNQGLKRRIDYPEGVSPDQSPSEPRRKHQRVAQLETPTERRVSLVEAHPRLTSANGIEAIAVQHGSQAAFQAARDIRARCLAQVISRHRRGTSLRPANRDSALLEWFIWWQSRSAG